MSGQCTQPSKPDEEELKINLGWKEGFSQRFHRLSPAALDKAIASLLAVQYQRGRQAPLDISNGDMQKLCSAARRRFLSEPSLLDIPAGTVIVGDLHGDFLTLRRIFREFGHPPKQRYLFLGDFVDRGVNGLHIVLLLFAYKLRYPDHVYLIRGNHESAPVTLLYGFYAECVVKANEQTWQRVCNVFDCLPVAALVAKDIFCVHGGLSPKLTRPDDVNSIQRPCKILAERNDLLSDLTWSDPNHKIKGWTPNPRGAGYFFGLDEARRFKEANGVRMIVRSHELVNKGWAIAGKKDVITVFSSIDYRNTGNDAAVLMVTAEGKCSIKVLRPEDETRDSETSGQTSSITASRESESSEQPCSARLSDCCSDQSSVTSMSLNASIDSASAAAAVAAADCSQGDGDAVPPLLALPAQTGAKKSPQGATELYAFALAAPRLDGPPPTGEHEEPAWRDSLHLKSESAQSADVKLAIKLAAKQMQRQPKAAGSKPLRMSIDRGVIGGTKRGSMHRLDSERSSNLSRAASSEESSSVAASNRASLDDALRRSKSATGANIYAELAAVTALAQTVR